MRSDLISAWEAAKKKNDDNVLELLEESPEARLLDLGCNNGKWTLEIAKKIKTNNSYGIEICTSLAKKAVKRGVKVKTSNLNRKFPFKSNMFDVVHANQVIEHLTDVDNFLQEIHRVLKHGGYAVISTENLSSLDNLAAILLGQQAFSQHISEKYHVGNRFSPHYGEKFREKHLTHKIIFSYFGIQQLFRKYKFEVEKNKVSGFFPLPNFLSRLDHVHSHFMAFKIRKL